MFQSKARLGCIKQLLPEAEKASGMLRFLLRNLEKLGVSHFICPCSKVFQTDIIYKVSKNLMCLCKENSEEASYAPFVYWVLFFHLFVIF